MKYNQGKQCSGGLSTINMNVDVLREDVDDDNSCLASTMIHHECLIATLNNINIHPYYCALNVLIVMSL